MKIPTWITELLSKLFPSVEERYTPEPVAHPAQIPEAIIPKKRPTLQDFCIAIRDYEGKPGDRNYRNCNPGNCRYSSIGYASIYGIVYKDKDNFAIFKDYATGFMYLQNLVKEKAKQHPDWTIADYIHSHAPSWDGNNEANYVAFICKRLKVTSDFKIINLL